MKENYKVNNCELRDKRRILYMLLATILFIIVAIIGIKIVNINNINRNIIIKDLNGINVVIGAIAIPCCFLYYYMYKNNEFYILTLSYISIFIEYIFVNYLSINIGVDDYMIIFPFLSRIILLIIAIFSESSYTISIVKRKRLSVLIVNITNIIGIYLEMGIVYKNIDNFNKNLINILHLSALILYFILLIILAFRCIRKNEFIYTIFVTTISIFTTRRIFCFDIFNVSRNTMLIYNRMLTFIAYLILLIGLYLEVVRRVEEGVRLNNKVIKLDKLEKKYNEIREVEKAKEQFFANLSHEIKTPINIIYSCVQLLDLNKKNGKDSLYSAYEKYEGTIKQNCYRLLRLVNNLVDMTKIDSGYMSLKFVNYEIVSLVEDITLSIVPYVESKNINVIFDTYIEELEIRCDPESIERVILNLLSNAVKFTNNGGNIFVLMEADEKFLTIRVKDDGVGVDDELKECIFERFVQADKSFNRQKEGSGIGLALAKSLIALHGGEIFLNSEESKGSEFVIKLPNERIEDNVSPNKEIGVDNKPLVQKIHIEFSDIYELY